MACTFPSHVQSLLDEGILRYWEEVNLEEAQLDDGDRCVLKRVNQAISHLISIDPILRVKIPSLWSVPNLRNSSTMVR
jgi:hypothetical protein